MLSLKSSFVLLVALFLFSCATPDKISYWKTQIAYPRVHNKIMVVSMVQDTGLRRQMEDRIVIDLMKLGYNAISSMNQFGVNGLHRLSQEQTYITLCSNGIDAIITIVLLDEAKEREFRTARFKTNVSSYYYNRIWNYYKIQANQLYVPNHAKSNVFWESIFIDLSTLEPLYTVKTAAFTSEDSTGNKAFEYSDLIVQNMIKHKVLPKQNKVVTRPLKPF